MREKNGETARGSSARGEAVSALPGETEERERTTPLATRMQFFSIHRKQRAVDKICIIPHRISAEKLPHLLVLYTLFARSCSSGERQIYEFI